MHSLYGAIRAAQTAELRDRDSQALVGRANQKAPTKRQLERLRAKLRATYDAIPVEDRAAFRRQRFEEPRVDGPSPGFGPVWRTWFKSELLDGIDPRKRSRARFDSPSELLMDFFVRGLDLPIRAAASLTRDVLIWYVGRSKMTCRIRNLAERYRWLRADPRRVPPQP